MRNFLIAGNWKMNCGPDKTSTLLAGITDHHNTIPEGIDVLVCPPSISLLTASEFTSNTDRFYLGSQNVHFEDNGAYTGEISTSMIKEVGCKYVIVGHSERREYFGETDITINAKVKKALDDDLKPVICVGESLEQRKKETHVRMVTKQVQGALNNVSDQKATQIVIAYEPIWAIGTGETATPEQAQEMHKMIRSVLADRFDDSAAQQIQIVYGGSMKPRNAESLLNQPDVDGGLIGGASLKADSFSEIINIADDLN